MCLNQGTILHEDSEHAAWRLSRCPPEEHNHANSNTHVYFCVQVKRKTAPLLAEPCLIAQHLTLGEGKKWWLPPGGRRYVAALGKKKASDVSVEESGQRGRFRETPETIRKKRAACANVSEGK